MPIELPDQPVLLKATASGASPWLDAESDSPKDDAHDPPKKELLNVALTFLTTLWIFGIYLVQGILVARILGPVGRGEFGTAIFFPRDILLYAGLLGGVEVVNSVASQIVGSRVVGLKRTAARMGIVSGLITAVAAACLATVMLIVTDRLYLLPWCLACCLFVPLEHIQLTISAVDRGRANYGFYNINRLLFALAFPSLLMLIYPTRLYIWFPVSELTLICGLFLTSRLLGVLPTLRGMFGESSMTDADTDVAVSNDRKNVDQPLPGVVQLLKDGRGYAVSMLATEVFERLDVLLILLLATQVDQVGYYLVAVPVAAILTIAPNALAVFTFNAGANVKRRVTLTLAVSVMLLTGLLQLVSALVYSQVMPWLLVTLFGDRFSSSITFALWLLPACAIKGYLQAADGYLKGCGRPLVGVWARALSVLVMLAFVGTAFASLGGVDIQNLILIPIAAGLGQAISMVIISTVVILDVIDREKLSDKSDYAD